MDMALLQAEALFGDRGQEISPLMDDDFFDEHASLSTSPELERAAVYYARKRQYAKAAHAALYSGFVQQHYNEKESAMRSFKEVEQNGRLAVDSLAVAQAEYWMGKMFIDDGMEQEALKSFMVSERYIGNHNVDRSTIENSKAVVYILMGQHEDAELCLRQSLFYAEKGHTDRVKRKIHNNYSVLYRLEGKYGEALNSLQQMINDQSLDNKERLVLYLNIGNVYFDMGVKDSTACYFQFMEELLPIVNLKAETKVAAYGALFRFAESQDDKTTALQYHENHEKILYDLMLQQQEQTIFRIQQQYDYESLQNVMNKKIIQRHITILIISILLLITTILILFLQYRHKQLLKSEEEMKQQLDDLKQDLLQTVKTSVLDHEISSRLRLILKVHDKTPQGNDPKKEWQSLVWQIMNGEQEAFEAARSVLETAYPKLYSTIKENYPDLTETEAKICLLSCSDLSNTEIAELLGLSTNTVNQNRSNLRKKLNLKPDRMKEQIRSALSK